MAAAEMPWKVDRTLKRGQGWWPIARNREAEKSAALRGKANTGSMNVEMLFMESAKLGGRAAGMFDLSVQIASALDYT